jgi:DNA-binding MarR family transcriptional regulator
MADFYAMVLEIRTLMLAIAKVSRQSIEQRLQAEGIELSHLQMITLRILDFEGAQTITELGRKLMMDPSTFVPSVDALERRGWVMRMRDPQDRRRVPISLTPEGKAIIQRLDIVSEDDMAYQAIQSMGVEKAHQLIALLRELVRHLPEGEAICQMVQARIQAANADRE